MEVAPVVAQWDESPPMEVKYKGAAENPADDVSTSTKMPVVPPSYGCHAVDPGVVRPDPVLTTASGLSRPCHTRYAITPATSAATAIAAHTHHGIPFFFG